MEETAPQNAPPAAPTGDAAPSAADLTQIPVEQTDATTDFASAFTAHAEREERAERAADEPRPADEEKPPAAATGRDEKGRFLPKAEAAPATDAPAAEASTDTPQAEAPP